MLKAQDISLIYRNGEGETRAVNRVSVTIDPGEFLGVVGPSGSGKSSLLYILSGLKKTSEGKIAFEGRDYAQMGVNELINLRRARYGFVFQQHFLINYLTVFENVMVAAPNGDGGAPARAKELLGELGMTNLLNRYPWQLSIGQRQRIAVARALINKPALVFADEPTASLDQTTGHQVVDLLAHYRGRGGIVFVTHDPDMLSKADHIIRMRDGAIVEEIKDNNGGIK